ncbi:MAG: M15 family metallopeptidase [Pseudomonadota bacterium]
MKEFARLTKVLLLFVISLIAFQATADPISEIESVLQLGPCLQCASEAWQSLPEPLRSNDGIRIDIVSLFCGYPTYCVGLSVNDHQELFVVMKNGVRILYDDRKTKSFEERLENPDLEDMLALPYEPGKASRHVPIEHDPGRFRVDRFLKAVYGESEGQVRSHLVPVRFLSESPKFTTANGASEALRRVGEELQGVLKKKPGISKYVLPLSGTFNWRPIAGTARLSPHAYAICIDLNSIQGAYWRWPKKGDDPTRLRDGYPTEIVDIFERHGFIWGGKWGHYDLMHFEYRPELLIKSRILKALRPHDLQDGAVKARDE